MSEFKPFTIERPWGNFRQFSHNEITTIKILTVNPNTSLSLQYHNHRSEFWHVISGHPLLTIGEQKINAAPGDEFEIKAKELHRLEAGDDAVQILEIAFGDFDEEDIVRIEDKYGRS
jgi:mannose-1-phosphate guanylyltransferase/mannose-1-phosphate guanylyltransferase/mannose-6-phosphate isomerase